MSNADRRHYLHVEFERFRVGHEEALLVGPDRVDIVPRAVADLLAGCRRPRSLVDHARALRPSAQEATERILRALAKAGWLAPTAAVDTARRPPIRSTTGRIDLVAVITRDRPECLERAIASYGRSCVGAQRRLLVVDDTRDRVRRATARRRVSTIADELGVEITYVGPGEKRHYAARLADAAGVDRRVVDFALGDVEDHGCSIGANRNAALLAAAGERLLCVDDDTLASAVWSPEHQPGVRVVPWDDSERSWFFSSPADTRSIQLRSTELVAQHEHLLGRDLSSLSADAPVDVGAFATGTWRTMLGQRRVVRVTCAGLFGDHGMPTSRTYLWLDHDSLRRLGRSRAIYHAALRSRQLLRVSPQMTITSPSAVCSTTLGIDLRALTPPFCPVGRGEDGLWGATLGAVSPLALVGTLPCAVLHLPPTPRWLRVDSVWLGCRSVLFTEQLAALSAEAPRGSGGDPAAAIESAGFHLLDLASLPGAGLDQALENATRAILLSRLSGVERALGDAPPGLLQRDLGRQREVIRDRLTQRRLPPADDLRGSQREARARARRLVRGYAELLCAWPRLFCAAERLRTAGRGLGCASERAG